MRPAPSAPVELPAIFGSRGLALACLGMDRSYWQRKLQEADAELDAARTRTQVNEAAKKLQRATTRHGAPVGFVTRSDKVAPLAQRRATAGPPSATDSTGHGVGNVDNANKAHTDGGNSASYLATRLKADHPAIFGNGTKPRRLLTDTAAVLHPGELQRPFKEPYASEEPDWLAAELAPPKFACEG